MPFVQMENISLFLQACRSPPLNLPSHDTFLTVDLYESKDPAQVLQCLGAFSRVASRLQPSRFPNPIGGTKSRGAMTPQDAGTGTPTVGGGSYGNRGRGTSNASNTSSAFNTNSRPTSSLTASKTGDSNSGRWSPTKNVTGPLSPSVSSWSKKSDEGATAPAWNISQYGYMGGASQGNLGVSFGGRRQITSSGPYVPSLAEKEKKQREREAEEERLRIAAEDEERRRREAQILEEEQARIAEEERWAEETKKLREQEMLKAQEEKRKWEEDERRWKLDEERRQNEEREAEARLQEDRRRARGNSDARLQGQFLSQYQAEHGGASGGNSSESSRVKELERELEQARERERQYERERQAQLSQRSHRALETHDLVAHLEKKSRSRSRSRPRLPSRKESDEEWRADERDFLRKQWKTQHEDESSNETPPKPPRPLPEPTGPVRVKTNHTGPSSRPLPDPATYTSPNPPATQTFPTQNRTDRYLATSQAPQAATPRTTYSNEIGGFDSAAERDSEDRRRVQSQQKTKAGGWASKSLLEREMEMERQRQQEWEESQKETKSKVAKGDGVDGIGGGIGGKWDVNQWTGYTGGDSLNKGGQGVGSGRRQIVGPRPPPGR
jgi:hypothetical protein